MTIPTTSTTTTSTSTYTPLPISFTTKTNLVLSSKLWTNHAAASNVADKATTTQPLHILALHGWLDNCASFDLLIPYILQLTDSSIPPIPTTIVAIDLAGHGLSSHRGSYLFVNGLNDISDVTEILGWKTFSLLGHSLGAGFSSFFAGIYPEKIMNIALIDGFAPFPQPASTTPLKTREHLDSMASLPYKSKPMYLSPQEAILARVNHSELPLTEFAAKKIVDRGLKPVFTIVDGRHVLRYTWRSDQKLRVPSPMYYTPEAVSSILGNVTCPVAWFIATHGIWAAAAREQEIVEMGVYGVNGDSSNEYTYDDDERLITMPVKSERYKWTRHFVNCKRLRCFSMKGGHHAHLESSTAAERIARKFVRECLVAVSLGSGSGGGSVVKAKL